VLCAAVDGTEAVIAERRAACPDLPLRLCGAHGPRAGDGPSAHRPERA